MLSEHARAKRGDMVLEIDNRLLEAIEKAQRLRAFDEGEKLESAALPSKKALQDEEETEARRLTPREIQQRLRAGESIGAIAKSSGTDEAWIRRFAAPVLAEQARVIERARHCTFSKRGAGPSGVTLGPSVAANVIERGALLTLPEIEAGWGAYQRPGGPWHVTFTFPLRGRRQTAEWEIDLATGELTARNKLAGELGWREPGKKLPQPKPAKAPAKRAAGSKSAKAEPAATGGDAAPATDAAAKETAAKETAAQDKPDGKPDVKAGGSAAESGTGAQAGTEDHTAQVLPLHDTADAPAAAGESRPPSTRSTRQSAASKRAAAATEAPAPAVATVTPTTGNSMPPTDLDVVDIVVDLRPLEEDAAREPAPIGSPPAPQGGPPAP